MNNSFKNGMFFTAIGQYSNVLIQLLINVVLSRLIPVEEFGVVATVQVFLVFFQLLVTAGMGPAIIQNKNLLGKDYGVLFNYTVIFSVLLAVLFGALGYVVAYAYGNPIYINLFWCMSVIVLSEGMNVVPTAILNKELRFKALNLRLFFCNAIGAIFGILAAIAGVGVYALIISVAFPAIATLIANFFVVRIQYTKSFDTRPLKEIAAFAKNQLGFTVLNYFSRNSDNLFIGKFLGPISLANYQKSYQLITMPNTVFLGIISPVLQPVLSKHQDNVKLIRETFMRIIHMLALLAFPLTSFMVMNSSEIVLFLFGSHWEGAVAPFTILAFSTWAQMLTSATGSIFMARNHSRTLFYTGCVSTILIVSCTFIGIGFGEITTVALFICIGYIINFITSYGILLYKVLDSSFSELLKVLISPILLGLFSFVVLWAADELLSFSSNFLLLVVKGIIWLLILAIYLFFTGEIEALKEMK